MLYVKRAGFTSTGTLAAQAYSLNIILNIFQ